MHFFIMKKLLLEEKYLKKIFRNIKLHLWLEQKLCFSKLKLYYIQIKYLDK